MRLGLSPLQDLHECCDDELKLVYIMAGLTLSLSLLPIPCPYLTHLSNLFPFALSGTSAFHMGPARMSAKGSALRMATSETRGGKTLSPGSNLKPMFDGTFKEAGAHLEVYTLDHENGSVAKVDTKTATCISWKTAATVLSRSPREPEAPTS